MTVKVTMCSMGMERWAEPENHLAYRFCQLLGRDYLTQEDCFIIQKMGIRLEIVATRKENYNELEQL